MKRDWRSGQEEKVLSWVIYTWLWAVKSVQSWEKEQQAAGKGNVKNLECPGHLEGIFIRGHGKNTHIGPAEPILLIFL